MLQSLKTAAGKPKKQICSCLVIVDQGGQNEVKFIPVVAATSITKSPTVVRVIMRHEKKYPSFTLGPLHGRAPSMSGLVQKLINVSLRPTSTPCATNSGT